MKPVLHRCILLTFVPLSAACVDAGAATAPEPLAVPSSQPVASSSYDGTVPYVTDAETPDEWKPRIITMSPYAYWEGRTAVGSSRVDYVGNRIEANLTLGISGPASTLSTTARSSEAFFWPDQRSHVTSGFRLMGLDDCGHVANISGQYKAETTIFFSWQGLTSLAATASRSRGTPQPECATKEEDAPVEKPDGGGGSGDGGGTGGDLGGCPECLDEPATGYTTCRVRYTYYVDTGEVIDAEILYCW